MKKSPLLLENVFHQQCLDIIKVSFKEDEEQVIQWILEFLFFLLSCEMEYYYNEKDDSKEEKSIIKEDVINNKEKNTDNKDENGNESN